MKKEKKILQQRERRKLRVGIKGTNEMPRISVYRSLKHIYAQIINDLKGITLVAASDNELDKKSSQGNKTEIAYQVGKLLAKKALDKKIEKVVFDKGCFRYHGRVKAVADGAREGGLKF